MLVILRHERRRLISLSVADHATAEWIAQQPTEAFPWEQAPQYLIRDRDASYGHAVTRRLAAMGIRDRPTAPRSPWQNGHVERLIGSIRREPGSHGDRGGGPLAQNFQGLCDLLRRIPNAPVAGQGRAGSSFNDLDQ